MNEKEIFMVSLNSKRLQAYLTEPDLGFLKTKNLDVFVFDTHEILNGLFFERKDASDQRHFIEETIEAVREKLISPDISRRNLLKYSKLVNDLQEELALVFQRYYLHGSFRRHCKFQVFRNLHPKMKALGIPDHKSNLVDILVPFLLTEIALYLNIYKEGAYCCTYGLEGEMEIMEAIKGGKYPEFDHLLIHPVNHIKVEIN